MKKIMVALPLALALSVPAHAAVFDFAYTDHRTTGGGPLIAFGQFRTSDELESVVINGGARDMLRITDMTGMRNGEAMTGNFVFGDVIPGLPGSINRPFIDPTTLEIFEFYVDAGGFTRTIEVFGATQDPFNPAGTTPPGWKEFRFQPETREAFFPVDMYISENTAAGGRTINFSIRGDGNNASFDYGAGQIYLDSQSVLVDGREAFRVTDIKGFYNRFDILGLSEPFVPGQPMYLFADSPLLDGGPIGGENGISFLFDFDGGTEAALFTGATSSGFGIETSLDGRVRTVHLTFSEGFSASAGVAPIPEPASWAMMIAGFGLAGTALRRTRGRAGLAAG